MNVIDPKSVLGHRMMHDAIPEPGSQGDPPPQTATCPNGHGPMRRVFSPLAPGAASGESWECDTCHIERMWPDGPLPVSGTDAFAAGSHVREQGNATTAESRADSTTKVKEGQNDPPSRAARPEAPQQEARAILLIELLRFTKHKYGCAFFSEHRTHCAKWVGFHESRYLDESESCNCGAGRPCSCGLHDAQRAVSDTYLRA